jgi:hypothetical protein
VTARKCSESHECASSVSNASVLVLVASSPAQAAQHGEYVAHAPMDKPTADQHTPHSTQPIGERPWYVYVPCTSASHTTRSDTTAYHYMHGKHGAGGSLAVDAAMLTVWSLLLFSLLNA